ncbi:MAG: hypothetical protein DRO00_03795 [Thermoproteota archaeon]|nr:MAG: hypothetical protein DRN92_04470 [Candidatus Korarchaeota archaeon]RLG48187.1 MAG: hypothetical protein DRN90_03855 [Candidatus Korarchaeota archaeon]RLG53508.1 MAG: hypothetical protein DRO00_03795 [Candidatus Korarchaeota archaeon]
MDINKLVVGISPTKKLYLDDPYLRESRATVIVSKQEKKNVYVILDESIYHPKGGGQPTDLGLFKGDGFNITLKKVMEVRGVLVHFGKLYGRLPQAGEEIDCILDWKRRNLIMRLHTAGHVLDYALKEVYGRVVDTLGALHGPPTAFTEYQGMPPTPEQIEVIQKRANEIVEDRREVKFVYVSRDELMMAVKDAPNIDRLPKAEKYRLVVIEGVNAIPCMGTHVKNTIEIGPIDVRKVEKTEKGFKLYYAVKEF